MYVNGSMGHPSQYLWPGFYPDTHNHSIPHMLHSNDLITSQCHVACVVIYSICTCPSQLTELGTIKAFNHLSTCS